MSDYSDALQLATPNIVHSYEKNEEKIKIKYFSKMVSKICQPQPLDYLINQNYATILLISFILIISYLQMCLMIYPMIETVHSKHEYFTKELEMEREELNRFTKELRDLRSYYKHNIGRNDMTCQKCWFPILNLNLNYIVAHVLENNRHVKRSSNDALFPLQCLLIAICFLNTFCMTMIFKEPHKLFIISNLLVPICLSIDSEFFIRDSSSVYHTLKIVVFNISVNQNSINTARHCILSKN
ncbi:unnamed protein product [Rotaria socialis]|uniref:Uncharacterized protein n=1 Tax=Rotaria socialis TaxID=392032 RepID=A0A819B2C4_9BILA|nr:unnamed protein product [Rotaria socialis]CAF3789528.1 unnamed protein product [Rotaria socialis]